MDQQTLHVQEEDDTLCTNHRYGTRVGLFIRHLEVQQGAKFFCMPKIKLDRSQLTGPRIVAKVNEPHKSCQRVSREHNFRTLSCYSVLAVPQSGMRVCPHLAAAAQELYCLVGGLLL